MSRGEGLSSVAAPLERIEERLQVLSWRLSRIEDQLGIVDLKLEGLDSIWNATRQIASAVGAGNGSRPHSEG